MTMMLVVVVVVVVVVRRRMRRMARQLSVYSYPVTMPAGGRMLNTEFQVQTPLQFRPRSSGFWWVFCPGPAAPWRFSFALFAQLTCP